MPASDHNRDIVAEIDEKGFGFMNETVASLSLENDKLSPLCNWLLLMLTNGQVKVIG